MLQLKDSEVVEKVEDLKQDTLNKKSEVIGDLNNANLKEIWHGNKMKVFSYHIHPCKY